MVMGCGRIRFDVLDVGERDARACALGIDATLQSHVDYATGAAPQMVRIADMNRDGVADLVSVDLNGSTVSVLVGRSDGTFATAASQSTAFNPYSGAVGDLDGNGTLDVVTANYSAGNGNSVSVLLGNGDGSLAPRTDFITGIAGVVPVAVAIADLDRDGNADLAVANYVGATIAVLLGNGDGSLRAHQDYSIGSGPQSVAVAELDGDGIADLVVTLANGTSLAVLHGNGDGSFGSPVMHSVMGDPYDAAVGDVDRDGTLDLIAANWLDNTIVVLHGQGGSSYAAAVAYPTGVEPRGIAIGDIDGDGALDIATANYSGASISVLRGYGDGTFQPFQDFATGGGAYSAAIGDLDGDGDADLAVASVFTNAISVLINTCAP